jgi:hypothetical protein
MNYNSYLINIKFKFLFSFFLIIIFTVIYCGKPSKKEANDIEHGINNIHIDIPINIRSEVRPLLASNSEEADCVKRKMAKTPVFNPTISYCCHLLKLYGFKSLNHPALNSGNDVVDSLTKLEESKKFFGGSILFQTRNGIRYAENTGLDNSEGENHRDICLANFAELGLPLTTQVTAAETKSTILELLQDSISNFDIRQKELEWTSIAFALYLTPSRTWTNRFGEEYSFDKLVDVMMKSPLNVASCGGTHLMYSLTVILRVDSQVGCLSNNMRIKLEEFLRKKMEVAVASQLQDGSWELDWSTIAEKTSETRRSNDKVDQFAHLLATGHMIEWFSKLPLNLQPPSKTYLRAARWLSISLDKIPAIFDRKYFCPYVHAINSIKILLPH